MTVYRKPSLSSAIVLGEIKRVMGNALELHPVAEGEESQAWQFLSGGNAYVVRVSSGIEGFEKDAYAFRRFARRDLPIPRVIYLGAVADHFCCISEHLPGVTLQDLDIQREPQLLSATAAVLKTIAGSDVSDTRGFGRYDHRGIGRFGSWGEFLNEPASYHWETLARAVDMGLIGRSLACIHELASFCPETRKLIHGDFGSNNVLAAGGKITGVLDWSEASIGDSLYDIANIFFWRTWLDCMEQQSRYFEEYLPASADFGKRLLCYQLRIGLEELYTQARQRQAATVEWASGRLNALLCAKSDISTLS